MKFLNKNAVVTSIAKKASLTKVDSAKALKALIETVSESLAKGEGVRLTSFGSFRSSHRKARKGRNPQTGKPLKIAAHNVPVFKAGKGLKKSVNK